ncbi:MAG: flagellar hook capping FlgD N-terminal domain-containing protein [Thermoguttaceae bacterium]|jgi:flagellar basal-body rod modification protein FlgD
MSTSSITSASSTTSQQATYADPLQNVTMSDFLNLLVTELQNQDPMNPMDDTQILQEVSQIKEIESNQRLSDTLTSMQTQQDLVAASTMLQKTVTGLADSGSTVTGQVDKVTVDSSGVKVCVGSDTISLANISEVDPNS